MGVPHFWGCPHLQVSNPLGSPHLRVPNPFGSPSLKRFPSGSRDFGVTPSLVLPLPACLFLSGGPLAFCSQLSWPLGLSNLRLPQRAVSQTHVALTSSPHSLLQPAAGRPTTPPRGEGSSRRGPTPISPPHLLCDAQILPLLFSHVTCRVPRVVIGLAHRRRHACANPCDSPSLAAEKAGGGTTGCVHLIGGRGQLGAAMFMRGNRSEASA